MRRERVLVIGYGNVLRGDDGVGPQVADALRGDGRMAGARIISCPQLTPELAEDVAGADVVVLIDARVGDGPPGSIRFDSIVPGDCSRPGTTHLVDATELVDLAKVAFDVAAEVTLVSVTAARFGLGEPLSPEVAAAVPLVTEAVVRLAAAASPDNVRQ